MSKDSVCYDDFPTCFPSINVAAVPLFRLGISATVRAFFRINKYLEVLVEFLLYTFNFLLSDGLVEYLKVIPSTENDYIVILCY